jgi:hypothetical protein
MFGRRRKNLHDYQFGPNVRKLHEVRDGIRGMRRALDRGACKDAAALAKLTEREMKKLKEIDDNTMFQFEVAKENIQNTCRVNFGRARRRRR